MGEFYRLKTFHGSLAEERATGKVVSIAEEYLGTDFPALTAYVPDTRPYACFLMSEHATYLHVEPNLKGFGLLPLGLGRNHGTTVSLYEPDVGQWCCAPPLDKNLTPPRSILAAARRKIQEWEQFTLLPVPPDSVPSALSDQARSLEAMLAHPLNLELIRNARPEDAAVLQAVVRSAPNWQREALAVALLASPSDARHLERLYPDDVMARHGLPVLADWLARRNGAASGQSPASQHHAAPMAGQQDQAESARRGLFSRLFSPPASPALPPAPAPQPAAPAPTPLGSEQTVGPELDVLARLDNSPTCTFLPYTLTALARGTVTPRRDLSIIATARNEGLYFLEWIAYHRALGVQAFFLYTNDNDDGSDALLSALARAGIIHWRRNQVSAGSNAQAKAYAHALSVCTETLDYRWALVIDLDEYLVVNPTLFRSAIEFLRWHEAFPHDAIALNWVMHGPAGQGRWQDDFIARRFPHPVSRVDAHIKTLLQPRRFVRSRPHEPQTLNGLPFHFRASNTELHVPSRPQNMPALSEHPNADFAWINHYFFKSTEEFLWKTSRNRGDHAMQLQPTNTVLSQRFVQEFVRTYSIKNPASVEPEQCAPTFAQELEQLTALPGVAEAWAEIKRIYAERIKTIVPMFADAPGIVEAGEAGQKFLATLEL